MLKIVERFDYVTNYITGIAPDYCILLRVKPDVFTRQGKNASDHYNVIKM
jgi:hypothetical protein